MDLQYEKLHKFCELCLRMTHEESTCRTRDRSHHQIWETHREHHQVQAPRIEEGEGRRQRSNREERPSAVVIQRRNGGRMESLGRETQLSPRRKPVRRDIMPDLEGIKVTKEEPRAKVLTKEWVRRTFRKGGGQGSSFAESSSSWKRSKEPALREMPTPDPKRPSWYGVSEETARLANQISAQNDKWKEVDRKYGPLESSREEVTGKEV